MSGQLKTSDYVFMNITLSSFSSLQYTVRYTILAVHLAGVCLFCDQVFHQ